MKCPRCGLELRKSPQEPNMGLCDNCMMKFDWVEPNTCRNCGLQFEGNFCPKCGTPAVQRYNSPQYNLNANARPPKKKKNGCLIALLIVVGALFLFILLIGMIDSDSENSDSATSSKQSNEEKAEDETPINADEYKAQCIDLDYKAVSRNPDDYIGQKFKVTVKIFSASENWDNGVYYKVYTDNGNGVYFDNMLWIFDKRDKESEDYIKLLEEDIVTFYGEFNGMQETENKLNGEKGEELALDIYYADLIQE